MKTQIGPGPPMRRCTLHFDHCNKHCSAVRTEVNSQRAAYPDVKYIVQSKAFACGPARMKCSVADIALCANLWYFHVILLGTILPCNTSTDAQKIKTVCNTGTLAVQLGP